MDERIERIKSWKRGEKKGPFALDIMPTNKCNLSCLACHQRSISDKKYYKGELTLAKYKQIIDEASELDVRVVQILGGGEPFLRKDLIELMEYIKNKDIRGYIVTNGYFLDKQNIKRIINMGWDEISFSFDSSDSETHDYLRQKKGSYAKIMKAINFFNEEKKKQNKDEPKLFVNYLVTNLNHDKIKDLVELCKKLGIEEINLMHMLVSSKYGKKLELNNKQYLILLKHLKDASILSRKYKIKNNFYEISEFYKNIFNKKSQGIKQICFEPFWHLVIGTSGYAVPCNMSLDNCIFPKNEFAENIKKKSLEKIWFGKKFENFRKGVLDLENKNSLCQECCSNIIIKSDSDKKSLEVEKG